MLVNKVGKTFSSSEEPSEFSVCRPAAADQEWLWPCSGPCLGVWLVAGWHQKKNSEVELREGTACFVSQAQTF